MKICGLNKTTLLDFPGKVAATIFLAGCNFRCPFCHNSSLVLGEIEQPEISQDKILDFLKKRKGILDGVCITGGEPTLQKSLPDFLYKIRELGYEIKLDTNGSHPQMLQSLWDNGLVNQIAMDIKSSQESYPLVAGVDHVDLRAICDSWTFSCPRHRLRIPNTVVRQLHREKLLLHPPMAGAKATIFRLATRPGHLPWIFQFLQKELEHFRRILSGTISLVEIRGID
ncbi:MAG: anaerobic ribonucleoside-triphosphate reductase activating protein [Blautia sp.]